MKKVLYCLTLLSILYACRKEEKPAFDKSTDERINETLTKYQGIITGSPNGWTATLVTQLGNTYSFYFRFNDSNRVVMLCDFDTTTAGVLKESSYRLKALQQPSLLFDTYTYIHMLADPDASVNNGVYGQGLVSDFEFMIDTCTADSVLLTGRFNGSKAIMHKASAQDRAAWENKQVYNTVKGLNDLDKIQNYFKRLTYNGVEYETQINKINKRAVITWKDGSGTPQTVTTPYYVGASGIQFTSAVVNGSTTIPGFAITSFDNTSSTLHVKVNNTDAVIAGAIKPINPDITAGHRWWQWGADVQSYYYSTYGFHVNGVDDAYHITTLANDTARYYGLLYWPGIQSSSVFDAFTVYFYFAATNSVDWLYGTGQNPSFQSDGRVIFRLLGDLVGGNYPASGPAYDTRTQLFNTSGFWFVQTSANSYDMISAKDAKAWITWQH